MEITKEEIAVIGNEVRLRGMVGRLLEDCRGFRSTISWDTVNRALTRPDQETPLLTEIRRRAKHLLATQATAA